MPIKVACKCGQQFAAKDELAGRVVKCPKCKQPLKVGGAAPAQSTTSGGLGDLLDEVGFHVHEEEDHVQYCPACDEKMSDHALMCVNCGYNLETGKFAKGVGGSGAAMAAGKAEGHAGAADMLLKKAERAIVQDAQEEKEQRRQGAPLWLLATGLILILTFAIGMSFLPRGTAFKVAGVVWMSIIGLAYAFFTIKLVVIAFSEGWAPGLMYLFVPFYALYFIFTRWDKCSGAFFMVVILGMLWNVGWALVQMSAGMIDTEVEESRMPPRLGDGQVSVALASAMLPPGLAECNESIANAVQSSRNFANV